MAAKSRTLRLILTGDADKLNRTLQRAQARSKGFGATMSRAAGAATKAFTGLVALGGAALIKFGGDLLKTGDQLDKMNRRTGLTVERIQELDFAAQQSGTSLETVEKALLRSARVTSDAANGLATAERTLEALGLTVEEVEATHPDQLFNKFADAISGVEDPTKRAALAQELFGRSGAELLPLLEAGSGGLEKLAKEARDTGNIMSEDAARAAAEFNDELNILKQELKAGLTRAFTALSPHLKSVISFLKRLIEGAQRWGNVLKPAAIALGGLTAALAAAKIATVAWNAVLAINPFVALTVALVAAGVAVYKFRDEIYGAFVWLKDQILAIWDKVTGAFTTAVDTVKGAVSAVKNFFTGGGGKELADTAENLAARVADGWDPVAERMAETARRARRLTSDELEPLPALARDVMARTRRAASTELGAMADEAAAAALKTTRGVASALAQLPPGMGRLTSDIRRNVGEMADALAQLPPGVAASVAQVDPELEALRAKFGQTAQSVTDDVGEMCRTVDAQVSSCEQALARLKRATADAIAGRAAALARADAARAAEDALTGAPVGAGGTGPGLVTDPGDIFTTPAVGLAAGGIVRRPTLAVVGEAGPEAVIPLRGGANPAGGPETINISLNLDGRELGKFVVRRLNEAVRRGEVNVSGDLR